MLFCKLELLIPGVISQKKCEHKEALSDLEITFLLLIKYKILTVHILLLMKCSLEQKV